MKKTGVVLVLLSFLALGIFGGPLTTVYAKSMRLVDANNKFCPVTSHPIMAKKFGTGYKGKKYWFANYQALKEFKSNPQKYLAKLQVR